MNKVLNRIAFAAVLTFGLVAPAMASVIPSPADDVASQANGGVAFSSSTGFGGTPDRVNDGNRGGDYFGDLSTAHTAFQDGNGFMGVNLAATGLIDRIIVWNRTGDGGCCGSRIDGNGTVPFEIKLGATSFGFFNFTQNITDGAASGMSILVPNLSASQVTLFQHNVDFMNIAEIEVFTIPEPATLSLLALGGLALIRRRQ